MPCGLRRALELIEGAVDRLTHKNLREYFVSIRELWWLNSPGEEKGEISHQPLPRFDPETFLTWLAGRGEVTAHDIREAFGLLKVEHVRLAILRPGIREKVLFARCKRSRRYSLRCE